MPVHWATPEETAEFNKKHPLSTMLIFSPKQTSLLEMVKATAAERAASQNRTQGGFNQTELEGFDPIREAAQERPNRLNRPRQRAEQIRRWRKGELTETFDLGAPSWGLPLFSGTDSSKGKIVGKSFLHVVRNQIPTAFAKSKIK